MYVSSVLKLGTMKVKFCLMAFCIMIGCKNENPTTDVIAVPRKIINAEWLVGTWSSASASGTNYEVWKKESDTVLVGSSFSVQQNDTVQSESVRLIQEGDEVSYIPIAHGQNNDLPVTFKLIFIDSVKMVFENKEHDFPQNISYQRISADSLVAEISGVINGTFKARQFPMRRN